MNNNLSNPETSAVAFKLLLIEDHPVYQKMFHTELQSGDHQFDIQIAHCGEEALQQLKNDYYRFSILLVNMSLPDMAAAEFIKACRRMGNHTPALVTISFWQEKDLLHVLRAGAQGCLDKDEIGTNYIRTTILRTIKGEYSLSPALARELLKCASLASPSTPSNLPCLFATAELDLLQLLAQGYSPQDAARTMTVPLFTVHAGIGSIYRKLHASSQ